jgi:hypothetical protein
MTPEQRARWQIDLLLQHSGWIVQDRPQTNLAAGPGVAIREAVLKTGEADYLLFAGGKAIATVEAKPEGDTLTGLSGLLNHLFAEHGNRSQSPNYRRSTHDEELGRRAYLDSRRTI